ncbi:uncharacterized protein LOC120655161 isoform X2 [Panicum virgatum]|uniref:uncharacterized protein LOC120655161 isoform X2 n=1 Tax=Panicum virgatum TaxID=38727 RepID=UPI0019D58C94|nr:uncharacterized protein LOC120655161 isoform X2 [Panicum virgatum]
MPLFVLLGVRGFYLQVTPSLSLPCHGICPHSETSLYPFPFQIFPDYRFERLLAEFEKSMSMELAIDNQRGFDDGILLWAQG